MSTEETKGKEETKDLQPDIVIKNDGDLGSPQKNPIHKLEVVAEDLSSEVQDQNPDQNPAPTITIEQLNDVKYHDFKAKFEELGIGDSYKHGIKKEDLIQIALEKLAILKSIEGDEELSEDEKAEKISKAEDDKKKALKADAEKAEQEIIEKESTIKEQIIAMKLSKSILGKNLHSINNALKNNANGSKLQRSVLISKQKAIIEILDEGLYATQEEE